MNKEFKIDNNFRSNKITFNISFNEACINLSLSPYMYAERVYFTLGFVEKVNKDYFYIVDYNLSYPQAIFSMDKCYIASIGF